MDWLEQLAKRNGRPLPDVSNPALGVQDWPADAVCSNPTDEQIKGCGPAIIRVAVYRNTVFYKQHQPEGEMPWELTTYWDTFLEQLLTALYLYKDLPEYFEVMVNLADLPVNCKMPMPVMQYTIINTTSEVTRKPIDTLEAQLVVPPNKSGAQHMVPSAPQVNRTRRFAVPNPFDWDRMSLSIDQLQTYVDCTEKQHGGGVPTVCTTGAAGTGSKGWAAARIPKALWRGTSTGTTRGWHPAALQADAEARRNYLARAMWNKRVALTVLSKPYPWMDVGLTVYWTKYFVDTGDGVRPNPIADINAKILGQEISHALMRSNVPLEHWTAYLLTLSLDGHGSPWRLSQQLLGMSPVLKVISPLKEWYAQKMVPYVHYEPVEYDLSDVVVRSKQLVQEAAADSSRLQCMAIKARDFAIDTVNGFSQLDNIVYAYLKTKRICSSWMTGPPADLLQLANSVLGVPTGATGKARTLQGTTGGGDGARQAGAAAAAGAGAGAAAAADRQMLQGARKGRRKHAQAAARAAAMAAGSGGGGTARMQSEVAGAAGLPVGQVEIPIQWRLAKLRYNRTWFSHGFKPIRAQIQGAYKQNFW